MRTRQLVIRPCALSIASVGDSRLLTKYHIDLILIQRYGSSRPLCVALQSEGVPWTGDFILAPPMWHGTRLFWLIVPEGRIGRKGKNEEKRGPDFPFLPFLPAGTFVPHSSHATWDKIKSPVHGTPSHCNATQRGRLDPYLWIRIRSILLLPLPSLHITF